MTTRRHALRTIAGATVVGSLSGCVQFATRETVEYDGTPAMITLERPYQGMDDFWALAVGIEGHTTVERFGITKDVVAHSWGLLYASTDVGLESESDPQVGSLGVVATFSTPSVEVAGQELNPVADLTVGDVGGEFAALTFPFTQDGKTGDAEAGSFVAKTVEDATGKKVLRAFRGATGARSTNPGELGSIAVSGGDEGSTPNWDGDAYSAEVCPPGVEECIPTGLHFEKHDGDFVVVFSTAAESVKVRLRGDHGSSGEYASFVHPSDDEFGRPMLERHLVETNLRGARGLVKRARTLVGETQELLGMGEYERETVIRTVSAMQDTIDDIRDTLGNCDRDACQTVLGHAEKRVGLARDAKRALEDGSPGEARQSLEEMNGVIEADIGILEGLDGESAERALQLERTLLEDTGEASLAAAQWQTLLLTERSLDRIDQLLGSVGEDLSSLDTDTIVGGRGDDTLQRITERSKEAAEVVARAQERVASHNETRNEENDRFVAIERNLTGLRRLTNLPGFTANWDMK